MTVGGDWEDLQVVIGSLDDYHVRIRPTRDGWIPGEPEWLPVEIEVQADPFAGSYEATWHRAFVRRFVDELRAAWERLDGVVEFVPAWEDSLSLRFELDGRGHVRLEGTARPRISELSAPELRFHLYVPDQTYLPPIIEGFEALAGWEPSQA
jgi:hypothetical protein